jgi:hypothetical protein
MTILFKYTSRSRPELFERGLKSIIDNCTSDQYKILVTVDENDATMFKYWNDPRITTIIGESKNKVDAINRDVNEFLYDWDILINFSDDMIFTQKGFDDSIRNVFDFHKTNVNEYGFIGSIERITNLDQCIHFPDGSTGDRLISMSILGRKYYERFNYIYNPEYISLYCDNETMDVAKILNCYKFINENIFVHLHPAHGNALNDNQYRYTESFHPIDKATYLKRKANNFGL